MGARRGAYRVLVGKPEGSNHLKDLGIDGWIILKRILEKLVGVIDWTDLAQYSDSWWAVVYTMINLWTP
jgi:hypothetical protein